MLIRCSLQSVIYRTCLRGWPKRSVDNANGVSSTADRRTVRGGVKPILMELESAVTGSGSVVAKCMILLTTDAGFI